MLRADPLQLPLAPSRLLRARVFDHTNHAGTMVAVTARGECTC